MVLDMVSLSLVESWGEETPFPPPFFILSAKFLSKMLNNLQSAAGYKGFYMTYNGLFINHLAFADDTILFCNGSKNTLRKVLDTLTRYEMVSG